MVTWQRRSSLGSRRVMGVTALGAVLSFLHSPLTDRPYLLPRWRSWAFWMRALGSQMNLAMREFSAVQQLFRTR